MRTIQPRKPTGRATDSDRRRTIWAKAREVRSQLKTYAEQSEVAAVIGVSKQMVEKIELEALSKVIARFAPERITEAAALSR